MATVILQGDVKVLELNVPDIGWLPIGCLTSNGFDEAVQMLGTTTRDNEDGWVSAVPTQQGYRISFAGLVPLDHTIDPLPYVDILRLREFKRDKLKIGWRMVSNGIEESGYGYITSIGDTAPAGDNVSFSGEILGTGKVIVTDPVNFLFEDNNNYIFNS